MKRIDKAFKTFDTNEFGKGIQFLNTLMLMNIENAENFFNSYREVCVFQLISRY